MADPTKRLRGRPVGTTKPPEERGEVVTMRVAGSERRTKLRLLGRGWLERAIDLARLPK